MAKKPFDEYRLSLEKALKRGDSTEHTHRPALKKLLESLRPGIFATNEPKHRTDCGAVDIKVGKGEGTVGFVETKDIGKDLAKDEKSDQLKRYRRALPSVILTDYLEFRWYRDGERVGRPVRLGTVGRGGTITLEPEGGAEVRALLEEFFEFDGAPPATAKDLATRLAGLAHTLRDMVSRVLKSEGKKGQLHEQLDAFRQTLIPDLDEDRFADMYAQTLSYGLFAARVECPEGKVFSRAEAADLIPRTNPFLRRMFHEIAFELEENIAPEVDYVAEVLNSANVAGIRKDFARRTGREDPVFHFYEDFLGHYDPALKKRCGIYYTPEPVVSYIVRSVDAILKKDFKKPLGLADDEVYILDPACGTGSFLHAVIRLIHDRLKERGELGTWSDYVRTKLLKRLFGFELLVAPYAVAHLKLGMLLRELDPDFADDQRVGVYLTNTLEKPAFVRIKKKLGSHPQQALLGTFGLRDQIVEEGLDAEKVKEHEPVMVVLGNPPYSNFGQANKGEWIADLLKDYKVGLKEQKINIDDDFIKFIRFGQWRIDKTTKGILAYISNNTYIDGITHRRMRQSLMESFDRIHVLDLHGSTRKKEKAPDGSKDENVFDIMQGVAIGLFVKRPGKRPLTEVKHAELWGKRKDKYARLGRGDATRTKWKRLKPQAEQFFFVPKVTKGAGEYAAFVSIADIFPLHKNGLKTDRDELFFDFDRKTLEERMRAFFSPEGVDPQFRRQYRVVDSSSYHILARRDATSFDPRNVRPCLYRPFDVRWLYYDTKLTSRPAWEVMQHVVAGKNLSLICCRQFASYRFFTVNCSSMLTEISSQPYAPLMIFPLYHAKRRRPNLHQEALGDFAAKLKLAFVPDGRGDLKMTFGPEDVFDYIYAILHSPTYRKRYAEFLKTDFPRIPLTSDKALFRKLVKLGGELVGLHLMESPVLKKKPGPAFNVKGSNVVEKVKYREKEKSVYINDRQHFKGVPQEVWDFHVGGYQVMQKWLKDRAKAKRKLTTDDVRHYKKIAVALEETITLMQKIDKAIPAWPIR